MTPTTSDGTSAEHTVIREIFHSIAVTEMQGRSVEVTFQAVPQENTDGEEGWLEFVTEEMVSLPWQETNLPDGRTPPEPKAAVGLISLLAASRIDLEISCQPDGTAEFSFEDRAGEEHEGTVTTDITRLRQLVGKLPTSRQRAT